VILSCVVLTIPECDGQTDVSTMAKTRETLHAVAHKKCAAAYMEWLAPDFRSMLITSANFLLGAFPTQLHNELVAKALPPLASLHHYVTGSSGAASGRVYTRRYTYCHIGTAMYSAHGKWRWLLVIRRRDDMTTESIMTYVPPMQCCQCKLVCSRSYTVRPFHSLCSHNGGSKGDVRPPPPPFSPYA